MHSNVKASMTRGKAKKGGVEGRRTTQPLNIIEDADDGRQFISYTTREGAQLLLRFDGEDPWLTRLQFARLFDVDITTASEHLQRFLDESAADEYAVQKFEVIHREGAETLRRAVDHYSLNAALYVGYRVNPRETALLQRWASDIQVQLAVNGFVLDVRRSEDLGAQPDYFEELLHKIRHIRSSEKRMWSRVLDLAACCSDYETLTQQERHEFFSSVQNAMHWAVTRQTAAEMIYKRVDASKPNAGLVHFSGNTPTLREVQTAKNFYTEQEMRSLKLLTNLMLEFAESQAEQRRLTTLGEFLRKSRDLLKLDGRPVIDEEYEENVEMKDAREHAALQFQVYKASTMRAGGRRAAR